MSMAATADLAAITTRLELAVTSGELPWAALLVTRDGADLYRDAFGVPVDHVDVLRSATKLATVTAVLTLVDDNTIGLEDAAATFIPAFSGEKAGITVRQLLSMASGLPGSFSAFSDELSLAEAADVIASAPLQAVPGKRFIYGNLGLTVAGRIAEIVSGLAWPEFFRRRVAEPLDMPFTYGPLDTGRLGGGGQTSLDGYGVLLKMHLAGGVHGGKQFLSTRLIEGMQESNGAEFVNLPAMEPQPYYGYGMAWWFDAVDSRGAPTVISDMGVWGAYAWIDRVRRYGGFLFIRSQMQDGFRLYNEIRPVVETALDELTSG